MKVNIGGRGRIPVVGLIAPIRDYTITQPLATNLLRFPKFPMYEVETGVKITPANINGLFNGNRKINPTKSVTSNTKLNEEVKTVDVPEEIIPAPQHTNVTPIVEPEPVIEETIMNTVDEEETVVVETVEEDTAETTEEVVEEVVEKKTDEERQNNNQYHNNKKKHNNSNYKKHNNGNNHNQSKGE